MTIEAYRRDTSPVAVVWARLAGLDGPWGVALQDVMFCPTASRQEVGNWRVENIEGAEIGKYFSSGYGARASVRIGDRIGVLYVISEVIVRADRILDASLLPEGARACTWEVDDVG